MTAHQRLLLCLSGMDAQLREFLLLIMSTEKAWGSCAMWSSVSQ